MIEAEINLYLAFNMTAGPTSHTFTYADQKDLVKFLNLADIKIAGTDLIKAFKDQPGGYKVGTLKELSL